MTHRERLLCTLRHETVDRVPDYEFGAWEQTIDRWHQEGLPAERKGVWGSINQYFHTDDTEYGSGPHVNIGLLPGFEYKVLEEKGDHIVVQDGDGAVAEMIRPELGASIPHYLRYAIETRQDWEKIRDEKLNPDAPGRVPGNLDELCKLTYDAEYPIGIHCGSIYGWIRNWMGVQNLSLALYDDPDWVEEMMEHLTWMRIKLYENLAGKCRIDLGNWWEDMCFNKGPLISPKLFAKYMVPRYKRITDFLRNECGCEFHILDCDGNIHELVPLWLEGGINVMFPVEALHTDGYKIADQFGKHVAIRGYFDKRALIAGKEAIDSEFERLVPLLKRGGFIPHTDHLVPPDVSWENYQYYRERKCEFIGKA
jgi:uroporphyrinogen-III decarboxylase